MAGRAAPPLPERYVEVNPDEPRGRLRPRATIATPGRRGLWIGVLTLPTLAALVVLWSVVGAYDTPGNESFSAKWADWFRAHHATTLVNRFEAFYYSHHQPKKGGNPRSLNAVPKATVRPFARAEATTALPAPSPVPLVVTPGLPGEGHWVAVGPLVNGQPGMYEAQFRADQVFTSEITTAVWIDPKLMKLTLIPGLTEPGGSWSEPPYIPVAEMPSAVAAFNGGFRFQDAHGGFYLDGTTAVPLVTGAASIVLYRNGTVNVGAWGREVTMTANVTAVLQNLVPMVDGGQVSQSATYNDTKIWGATLGANVVVPRSGVGVTADGAVVYVAGPALTARTLAESLQRAGAVRAMTLDINPEWVTFNFFTHTEPTDPNFVVPSKLYPQMVRPADRYLAPVEESRDFFMVSTGGGS